MHLHFQKDSGKILFSKSTEGSSGCLALYLILYSRNVLNSSQTFYIHGVWVFCDTALGEYWFYTTLHKVELVHYGEEKPWIKAAERKFSHAAHVCGLVQIMAMLYLLDGSLFSLAWELAAQGHTGHEAMHTLCQLILLLSHHSSFCFHTWDYLSVGKITWQGKGNLTQHEDLNASLEHTKEAVQGCPLILDLGMQWHIPGK